MEKPVRAAGFIIFRRMPNIQYLLMQTSYGKNHWSPPKGHLDPGENDLQAAYRETEEEAGFPASALRLVDDFKVELKYTVTSHRDGKDRPKITTYWLAELLKPHENVVKMSDEHQDFKWLALEEAKTTAGYPDFQQALDQCHQKLQSE